MAYEDMSVTLEIDSRRMKKTYRAIRFTEFNIDIDLETDSDICDFTLKNPGGVYSGLFSKFDDIRVAINLHIVMEGNIDQIVYIESDSENYVQISCRDLMWKLVDNDALPTQKSSVNPKTYIKKKCKTYGIKCKVSQALKYKKLTIGCGESEISIINNILLESKQRVWFLVNTLYTGTWGTGKSATKLFTMYTSAANGIPIEEWKLTEDGSDQRSEVRVYKSTGSGKFKMTGKSINEHMKKIGIIKVETCRQYSDKASTKYKTIAQKHVRDSFRNNQVLEITVRFTTAHVFMPNTVCRVINGKLGVDAFMFIKKVTYRKTMTGGSIVLLSMIPANTTFEKIWQEDGESITNPNNKGKNTKG